MPPTTPRRFARFSMFLFIACMVLPSSGCLAAAVTAGVVGAGAAGYAYWQGATAHDYQASMDQTWEAAKQAALDLGLPIVTAVRDNDGGTIESRTGDGTAVKIRLEPRAAKVPADGQWTHVIVRVGLVGDGPVADRLFNQLDARLAPLRPPGQVGQQVPVTVAPTRSETGAPPLAH